MGFPGGTIDKESAWKCRRCKRRVQSLGLEDPLEEGMATHSSILAWRIPMDQVALWATVYDHHKESDMTERLNTPIPVFLPGEFHEERSLAGCNPWG